MLSGRTGARWRKWTVVLGVWLAGVAGLAATGAEWFSLEEVRPGLRGEWHTVVSGTEVVRFPLEVIGIVPNFAGPQRSVILCRAVDPVNIGSGPVGGMSGSPVYFEGRLAGAYAYGFTWPKNQAIIGVTPIADMMEVLEFPDPDLAPGGVAAGWTGGRSPIHATAALDLAAAAAAAGLPVQPSGSSDGGFGVAPGPLPLLAGGFSPRTLAAYAADWRALGVEPLAAPGGPVAAAANAGADGAAEPGVETLVPGGAVAGVLMTGDFSFVGTGTVTWRDGDRLLAFGHPFFSFGQAAIPMAPASVLTVVQSVQRSFKLSNHGPIIGTITQDRISAIAGVIGTVPHLIDYAITVRPPLGPTRTFRAEVFQHGWITPLLVGMALDEAVAQTQETVDQRTLRVTGTIDVAGHGRIELYQATTKEAERRIWRQWQEAVAALLANPFEPVTIERLALDVQVDPPWGGHQLRSVQVVPSRVRAGEDLVVDIVLGRERAEPLPWQVRLPVPTDVPPGTKLTFLVADAETAAAAADHTVAPVRSVGDIVTRLRATRRADQIYALLLRPAAGVIAESVALPDLPPSVRATLLANQSRWVRRELTEVVVAETALPLGGPFEGRFRLEVTVE